MLGDPSSNLPVDHQGVDVVVREGVVAGQGFAEEDVVGPKATFPCNRPASLSP